MGNNVPFWLWGASAIQSEAGPTKSHSYIWEILSKTETSPCWYLNRDGVGMGVVLNGKVDWRWGRDGVGKLTSISHISYPSEKNIQALFQLSAGLGLQSTFRAKSGGSHLTTNQQNTKLREGLEVPYLPPLFQGVRPVSKEQSHQFWAKADSSQPVILLRGWRPQHQGLGFGEGKLPVHDRTPHVSLPKDHTGHKQQPLPAEFKIWLKAQDVSTSQCTTTCCWTKPTAVSLPLLLTLASQTLHNSGPNTFRIWQLGHYQNALKNQTLPLRSPLPSDTEMLLLLQLPTSCHNFPECLPWFPALDSDVQKALPLPALHQFARQRWKDMVPFKPTWHCPFWRSLQEATSLFSLFSLSQSIPSCVHTRIKQDFPKWCTHSVATPDHEGQAAGPRSPRKTSLASPKHQLLQNFLSGFLGKE